MWKGRKLCEKRIYLVPNPLYTIVHIPMSTSFNNIMPTPEIAFNQQYLLLTLCLHVGSYN